jgi:hypothetical protein
MIRIRGFLEHEKQGGQFMKTKEEGFQIIVEADCHMVSKSGFLLLDGDDLTKSNVINKPSQAASFVANVVDLENLSGGTDDIILEDGYEGGHVLNLGHFGPVQVKAKVIDENRSIAAGNFARALRDELVKLGLKS